MPIYRKELDIRYTPDILVCGGGPAGVAAAYTAATAGANVMLIEATGTLGGTGTQARIPMFCSFTDGINFLADGFGRIVFENMLKNGHANPADLTEHSQKRGSISINNEYLKSLYDDLMMESGAKLLFQTKLVDAIVVGEKIDYAVCQGKSDLFAIKAKVYLDCTGDADLAYHAGAETLKGGDEGEMQAGSLCSQWTDIDWSTVYEDGYYDLWPRNAQMLDQAVADGVITQLDPALSGMWRTGRSNGTANISHEFGVDGTDEESLTTAYINGRKRTQEYQKYYRDYLGKCFKNIALFDTAPMMGIRESRRIVGDYLLTADDHARETVFDDEIGRYGYDIDVHSSKGVKGLDRGSKNIPYVQYKDGQSYGIPYRCLIAKGFDNLLMAGRCISADRPMQGSTRVMPGCFITGQAVGLAAKLAVDHSCSTRDIPIHALQKGLVDFGAYLPNFKK